MSVFRSPTARLAMIVALLSTPSATAARSKPCDSGRFVVTQGAPILVLPLGQSIATGQALVVDSTRRLSISPGCDGIRARLKGTKNGTKLSASGRCPNISGKVRITAMIARDCTSMTGKLKQRKVPRRPFTAQRATGCHDRLFDPGAGEECDGPGVCFGALVCTRCRCRPTPTPTDDADVVLVLPASSEDEKRDMIRLLQPWTDRAQPLAVSYVSLPEVAGAANGSMPAAEDIRQYLRERFTPRPTTTDRPRYLGLVALPYPEYGDPRTPLQLPTIPRFSVQIRNVEPEYSQVETDVPYGFLAPETIDGGDGFVDPDDLDMRAEAFTVFRIPIGRLADLEHFVIRANEFAQAVYRSDVALVAGEFGAVPGDTSFIQCLNMNGLSEIAGAGRVVKIFDYPTPPPCAPDFLTAPAHRLAHFLADSSDSFRGGMVYDISHGNADAIYAGSGFPNLHRDDLGDLAEGELNVFMSISCKNDAHLGRTNLAMDMYLHNSVAVVSATVNLFAQTDSPQGVQAIVDAEVNAFLALYRDPLTLLQGLHSFRSAYYGNYAIGGPIADRPYHWINLLAVHVLGDGLVVVAK